MIIVQQMIDEAQANAKARLLKVDDVMNAIKEAENKLKELRIPKKYWVGCWVIVEPESVAVIVRKSSGWKLANVFRDKCKQEPWGRHMRAKLMRAKLIWKLANVFRDKCKQEPWGRRMRAKLILSDVAHNHIPKEYVL